MDREPPQASDKPATGTTATDRPRTDKRRRRAGASPSDGPSRTSQACEMCRQKKVKCDGQWPCRYCAKRQLNCEFGMIDKRRMYSVSEIQQLKGKVAQYEGRTTAPAAQQSTHPDAAPPITTTPTRAPSTTPSAPLCSPRSSNMGRQGALRTSAVSPSGGAINDAGSCPSISVTKSPATIAPDSALSSSDNFGSEIRSLLVSRTGFQRQGDSPVSLPAAVDSRDFDAFLRRLPDWPSLAESQEMLDLVVLNVGISQQLFDVRLLSDHLHQMYQPDTRRSTPRLWIVEVLLVMAVGRLLQAKSVPNEDLPGASLFREASRLLPGLSVLNKHGVLGIEVVALTALYLQIADQKEEAYVQASLALHLAIAQNMHRVGGDSRVSRSEVVHRNRLWWSVYMQQRRLAAAGGYPIAIQDETITVDAPADVPGFTTAGAIAMNVRAAKVTGQITWTIYTQKGGSEASFIEDVHNIFRSIGDLEHHMPAEYVMSLDQGHVKVGGLEFARATQATARTSSSLYLSIYQAFIHAGRPILLFMARKSHEMEHETQGWLSPSLWRLAEVCVQAASKSLLILNDLCSRGIIAKNAFLDLDAVFSAGFVFVLVEIIAPGRSLGACGISVSRGILTHLMDLGNHAASRRLAELDQMCAHLGPYQPLEQLGQSASTDTLSGIFSFERGFETQSQSTPTNGSMSIYGHRTQGDGEEVPPSAQLGAENGSMSLGNGPILHLGTSDISLDGEDGISWVFQPGMYTGSELADWEMFESQLNTTDLP